MPAGEFKAKCLALLDEVSITGEELIVTKRGKPVAKVTAVDTAEPPTLIGSVRWEKDMFPPWTKIVCATWVYKNRIVRVTRSVFSQAG